MRDKTICYCCGAECKAWNDSGFMDCCALCADQVLIIGNPSSPKKIIGKIPICKRCNEPAEFAEPSDDFTCYRCSH